jgi:uncharacterized repeat protein (TIGR01451 family)
LGFLWDSEVDGQPTPIADGDDLNLLDDEDGVIFGDDFVDVIWNITRSGLNEYRLRAWWDVDQNGFFDHPSELFIDDRRSLDAGVQFFRYALPFDPRLFYSRFRLTWIDDPDGVRDGVSINTDITPWGEFLSADGISHGEVEDYPPSERPPQPEALPPPRRAELIMNKECHRQTVRVGDQLIYRLSVRNLGPSDATDVVITDTLPENVEFVRASSGCLLSGRTVICRIGNLAEGAKETREITVRPTAPGRLRNTATVTANEPDRHLANNTATVVCRAEELLIPTRPAR